jgi:site-specific DNA-cytosine methylase
VLELFAGIGGCAAALAQLRSENRSAAEVIAAVDIDEQALAVYRRNFSHRTLVRTIESMPAADFARFEADLWWLSPPCQPYTKRGLQRDVDDPRAAALANVRQSIAEVLPQFVVLENVPEFADSIGCGRLKETLAAAGYEFRAWQLCPTMLGWPMRRLRYYLLASREPVPTWELNLEAAFMPRRLSEFLLPEDEAPECCFAPTEVLRQYASAINIVDADNATAVASCFTSAYGTSPIRSGSYLRQRASDGEIIRRFAPQEVLRLLGFSKTYSLPADLSARRAWALLGNSLAVSVVKEVLSLTMRDH